MSQSPAHPTEGARYVETPLGQISSAAVYVFLPVDFHFTVSPLPLLPARYALQHIHICHLPSCRGPYFEDRLVPLHPTPPAKGNVNSCMCSWHNCDSFSAMGPWLSSITNCAALAAKLVFAATAAYVPHQYKCVSLLVQTCGQKNAFKENLLCLPFVKYRRNRVCCGD